MNPDTSDSHLLTAVLRYLVDEKKLLTQEDVDKILDLGEQYRKQSEAGFAEFQATPLSERKKRYRHLHMAESEE